MVNKQITVHLNKLVLKRLKEIDDPNLYVDEVLSKYFGIKYEDAYPPNYKKKWDNHVI